MIYGNFINPELSELFAMAVRHFVKDSALDYKAFGLV